MWGHRQGSDPEACRSGAIQRKLLRRGGGMGYGGPPESRPRREGFVVL